MTSTSQQIALEALIGPRPARVNSENRNTVRKWCRAVGIPSLIVEKLTTSELSSAYNDTQALADLISKTPPVRVRPAPTTLSIDSTMLGELVANAVADALANQTRLTEDRVRELIREYFESRKTKTDGPQKSTDALLAELEARIKP